MTPFFNSSFTSNCCEGIDSEVLSWQMGCARHTQETDSPAQNLPRAHDCHVCTVRVQAAPCRLCARHYSMWLVYIGLGLCFAVTTNRLGSFGRGFRSIYGTWLPLAPSAKPITLQFALRSSCSPSTLQSTNTPSQCSKCKHAYGRCEACCQMRIWYASHCGQ